MIQLVDRAKAEVADVRRRRPFVDHVVRMFEHYSDVQGNILAGAVTYFGYLSFFPVLALAFAVIGVVANVYPDAQDQLIAVLESIFPGLVGDEPGDPIKVETFTDAAATAGLIGAAGLFYTGLGWISVLRTSLQEVFQVPQEQQRNLVLGKAIDLVTLAVIGIVLLLSILVSGITTSLTETTLSMLGLLGVPGMDLLLSAVSILVGVAASTVMFFAMFRILLVLDVPQAALWKGALLAAIGFEALKALAWLLIGAATGNPATAILGTSLVLLVWINYFSRVAIFGAAWAYTTEEAQEVLAEPEGVSYSLLTDDRRPPGVSVAPPRRRVDRLSLAFGALIGVGVARLLMGRRHRRSTGEP